MNSFVYKWVNTTIGKEYIGYHKGNIDDGYIASSKNEQFWNDFNNPEYVWIREILFEGTKDECLLKEQEMLKEVDIRDEKYYNNARGAKIIFTTNVLNKMSISGKRRWDNMSEDEKLKRNKKISDKLKGKKRTDIGGEKNRFFGINFLGRFDENKQREIRKKIGESQKGKKKHSEEWKKFLSEKYKGNDYGKYQTDESKQVKREKFLGDKNPGKFKTEETIKKMSDARKGIPAKNNKPIIIDGVEYYSLKDASDNLKIHPMTIKYRLLSNNVNFNNYKYK